jgi:hypothetical protein
VTPTPSATPSPQRSISKWRRRQPHGTCNCPTFSVPVLASRAPPRFVRKRAVVAAVVAVHTTAHTTVHTTAPLDREVATLEVPAAAGVAHAGEEATDAITVESASPPADPPPADPPPADHAANALGRRRGGQRWSALVSAPSSRVARTMRPVLGEEHWAAFVAHATAHHKPLFLGAFAHPQLRCVGTSAGGDCPCGYAVDLAAPDAKDKLERLHLDHEQDVQVTCDMWRAALPPSPRAWDDGVDGALLCHLLFGVGEDPTHGPPMVRFRCGPSSFGRSGEYCHQLNMPHYRGLRDVVAA